MSGSKNLFFLLEILTASFNNGIVSDRQTALTTQIFQTQKRFECAYLRKWIHRIDTKYNLKN